MADLVTSQYVLAQITNLTTAQTAALGAVITSASALVEDYCNRKFSLATYVDTITDQPFNGLIKLRQYPVTSITRLAGYPTSALSITNNSPTVQRATVQIVTTGDWDSGLTVTGLKLISISSAVTTTNTIAITSTTTLANLMASVNGYSSAGWYATVPGPLAQWAATELIPPQGTISAMNSGAYLTVFTSDLNYQFVDASSGIFTIASSSNQLGGLSNGNVWFPGYGGSFVKAGDVGYASTSGGLQNPIVATYIAGYATIPIAVQQATIPVINALFDDVKYSQALKSQKLDDYSYELITNSKEFIPLSSTRLLSKYVNWEIR